MRSTFSRAKSLGNAAGGKVNLDQLSKIAEMNQKFEAEAKSKEAHQ